MKLPFTTGFRLWCIALFFLLIPAACSSSSDSSSQGDTDSEAFEANEATELEESAEEWTFDRNRYTPVNGWILLDSNLDHVAEVVKMAKDFGVNHVQLSHDLIMDIDEVIFDDEDSLQRRERLAEAASLAKAEGLEVFAWAHEFTGNRINVCFDPEDPFWDERRDAYRLFFEQQPDIDGIVLMYGSASPDIWYSICTCDWCLDSIPEGEVPLIWPNGNDRVEQVTRMVGEVVVDELGKGMYVRSFIHSPQELEYVGMGLRAIEDLGFYGMSKDQPQDWEPYYPDNKLIGDVGPRPSVVELDLAGEYWGRSYLLWMAPKYYIERWDYMWNHRGVGTVSRIERGSDHAIGQPNEINVFAISYLHEHGYKNVHDDLWQSWLESKYGVTAGSTEAKILQRSLERSYDFNRKMYYILGFWALEKSSSMPDSIATTEFVKRNMALYDPDYEDWYNRLSEPDLATVEEIHQEKLEALSLVELSLADLDSIKDSLNTSDYEDLHKRLRVHHYALRAWTWVAEILWARHLPDHDGWIRYAIDRLNETADEAEAELGNAYPAQPSDIRRFADAAEKLVDDGTQAVERTQLLITDIEIEQNGETATITWKCNEAATFRVEWGEDIPDYGQDAAVDASASTQGSYVMQGQEDSRTYFRIHAEAGSRSIVSGDFMIRWPWNE